MRLYIGDIRYIEDFYLTMEIRRGSRHNTGSNLPKSLGKKHNTLKVTPSTMKKYEAVERDTREGFNFLSHPASQYIRGTMVSRNQFKKFITLLYRGLYYSVHNLKGPSDEFIKKKSVTLPQPKHNKKKFLLLDLDETLIHSVFNLEKADVTFCNKGDEFKFNIRPYCFEFLEKMNEYYSIYVFTASTADYAEPIVAYLNEKKKTIQGVLNRKNCMQTHNGFYIKDLRIIKNRGLKDIILVDNLVHSFGLQIENGIPILQYLKGKEDKELIGLQKLLIQLSEVDDVRSFLKTNLELKKKLEYHEEDFTTVPDQSQKRLKTMKL